MSGHEDMPLDPDLDELPPEIADHPGPLVIEAVDPDTGAVHRHEVSREALAATFAHARRLRDDDIR